MPQICLYQLPIFMLSFNIEDLLPYIKSSDQSLGIGQLTYLLAGQNSRQLNSALYANRGTTHWLATQLDKALQDFEKSIEYNHLNYVSYFNLHTFYYRTQKMEFSLKNLCCSLSCLYLLRGKNKKDENDINKAIQLCQNNLQAHLAKGLHYLQNGKHKLALNELNWVLEIEPTNRKVQLIKSKIEAIVNPQLQPSEKHIQSNQNAQIKSKRLQCSLYDDGKFQNIDVEQELNKKLSEFNQLYCELNKSNHLQILASPPVYLLSKNIKNKQSEHKQTIQENTRKQQEPHNRPIQFKNNLPQVTPFDDRQQRKAIDDEKQDKAQPLSNSNQQSKQDIEFQRQQVHKKLPIQTEYKLVSEADQIESKGFKQNKNDQLENLDHEQVGKKEEEKGKSLIEDNQGEIREQNVKKYSEAVGGMEILNEKKEKMKEEDIVEEATKQIIEGYLYTSPPKKPNDMSEPRQNSSSYTFRTPDDEKNLSIRIHKVQITNLSKEELSKLKNIYCRFKYGRKKFETKDISEDFNNQKFDQSFETELEDQPQVLEIQVFNKQLLAFNDTELGRGEKEVTMTGRIEVPIYLDQEKEDLAGKVYLDIRYK